MEIYLIWQYETDPYADVPGEESYLVGVGTDPNQAIAYCREYAKRFQDRKYEDWKQNVNDGKNFAFMMFYENGRFEICKDTTI